MVEPTFNTEDIDEFLDRIRIAKLKAEMRGQQQQIDRPSVVTIRRLEVENAKLKKASRECVEISKLCLCSTCTMESQGCNDGPFVIVKAFIKAREVLGE